MLNYIKVPKSLIFDRQLYHKRVLVFVASIFMLRQTSDDIENEVIKATGYNTATSSRSIKFQIGEIMCMIDKTYLIYNTQGNKPGTPLAVPIDTLEPCGVIYRKDFEEIMQRMEFDRKQGIYINHGCLLLLLSYLRLMSSSFYGLAEFNVESLNQASELLGISESKISDCIKLLEDLEIIRHIKTSFYSKGHGQYEYTTRIFVDRKPYIWT